MIAIVTIDDNNGMMFNKRRQSKDIRLIDYCFVENVDINELQDNISKIYVYKWNRKYPSDVTFPVAMLDNYQLENVSEFEGNSHDKITEEIYIRSKV